MPRFADHFSAQASAYARFRPRYPKNLFSYLASVAPGRKLAWDCATGNGQAAVALAELFEQVVATDASEKQIANAESHQHIDYRVAPAENSGIDSGSIELITVAQALHWFDLNFFYTEAKRVLYPRGVIAAWAYNLLTISPAIDAIINYYYSEVVGAHWPAERALVEKFDQLQFPFLEIKTPSFDMIADWNLEHLIGYLRTWSATQRFMAAHKRDPVEIIEKDLRSACGNPAQSLRIVWPSHYVLGAPNTYHPMGVTKETP